jgi:outer membrane receptor protein involved in Fe transport
MGSYPKISCAITAILSGSAAGFAYATPATNDTAAEAGGIQEVTVTAQRRIENMQNVPITIQALTAETLTQLNVATFDDFVKYLPNVTVASWGPTSCRAPDTAANRHSSPWQDQIGSPRPLAINR